MNKLTAPETLSWSDVVGVLKSTKRSLMHQRLFGMDTLNAWRSSAVDAEGSLEEVIHMLECPQVLTAESEHTEDQSDLVTLALKRAWQLGQTYWQQADSEFVSHHKKADETQRKFQTLVDETHDMLNGKSPNTSNQENQ